MASPTIAVRVKPEIYEQIQARATKEGKTVTVFVQEVLQRAVSGQKKYVMVAPPAIDKGLLEGLEKRLTEHLLNNMQMTVEAAFYARDAAYDAGDLAVYFRREIEEMEDSEQRQDRDERLKERCLAFSETWKEKIGLKPEE